MKYYKLTKEEERLLRAFERGEFKPVREGDKKITLLRMRQQITVDIPPHDLDKLEAKAKARGVSREKLAADVLHQYTSL